MTSTEPTLSPVQLQYTLTRDDWLDAFAAQFGAIRRPWYLRRVFLGSILTLGVLEFVFLVLRDRFAPWAVAPIVFPIVIWVMYGKPRLFYRRCARQIMASNPAFSQPVTVSVTEAGVRVETAVGESTVGWRLFPFHAETDRAFVLLASNRLGGAVQPLPKRGLGDSDAAPMRALLAAHSQRLG